MEGVPDMEEIDADEYLSMPEREKREKEPVRKEPESTVLAPLNTFAPAVVISYQHLFGLLESLKSTVGQLYERVSRLGSIQKQQWDNFRRCYTALSECQQQTAKAVNREVERHALNPAIETVVALVEEISRLNKLVQQLEDKSQSEQAIARLREESQVASCAAHDKLAYLDIELILPLPRTQIDPQKHSISGQQETDDEALHGKVCRLSKAGIVYRGKMLRPAHVTVFRCESVSK
jgi:molecular chaperone GrpE (heat shock protein)